MERFNFGLLFRSLVRLVVDDKGDWKLIQWFDYQTSAGDCSIHLKNRSRLRDNDIAARLLSEVLVQPRVKQILSSEHFCVDGMLVEVGESMKSFKPKDTSDPTSTLPSSASQDRDVYFRNEKRFSTTGPYVKLFGNGSGIEAKLAFFSYNLMEKCFGLLVNVCLKKALGHSGRIAAPSLIETHADQPRPIALAVDRTDGAEDFVNEPMSTNPCR